MKVQINEDKELVAKIIAGLKANNGYCPCSAIKHEDTKCMCKDFKENVKVGEMCHCGLHIKVED